MGTTLTSEDSDLEACVEEVGENGWAEIARSLRDGWRSVSLQGHGIGKKWPKGMLKYFFPYPCQCDFSDTTHVVGNWFAFSVIGR